MATKRKGQSNLFARSKKIKMSSHASSKEYFETRIKDLEVEILRSRTQLNKLQNLIMHMHDSDSTNSQLAMITLCRVFARLLASGSIYVSGNSHGNDTVVQKWLLDRLHEFRTGLLRAVQDQDAARCITALGVYLELMDTECAFLKLERDSIWTTHNNFAGAVTAILRSRQAPRLRAHFVQMYAQKYLDILSNTLRLLGDATLIGNPSDRCSIDAQLELLSSLSSISAENMPTQNFLQHGQKKDQTRYGPKHVRAQAGDAWLSILSGDLSKAQRKKVLSLIPHQISQSVNRLEYLSDFLDDSLAVGGSTALMALSGLYHLIKEKNLDYPNFYSQLYKFVNATTLHSKHRSKFLRLLETFLSSTHLSATLTASFIKRLSRLCLSSPPSAIVAIVPFIYNLLKAHPSCTFMIHRRGRSKFVRGTELEQLEMDPFQAEQDDPMHTGGVNSSLWEIHTLQSHYHPNVATLCKVISEQFTKQGYNLEDFRNHSYASVLNSELLRDMKKVPVVESEIPKRIFLEGQDSRHTLTLSWRFEVK